MQARVPEYAAYYNVDGWWKTDNRQILFVQTLKREHWKSGSQKAVILLIIQEHCKATATVTNATIGLSSHKLHRLTELWSQRTHPDKTSVHTLEDEEPAAIGRDIAPCDACTIDVETVDETVTAAGVDTGAVTEVATTAGGSWLAEFGGSCVFAPYSMY